MIPNLSLFIAPIVTVGHVLQDKYGDVNLKKTSLSESGCWSSSLSVNATTGTLHTEDDCAYTVISVPSQRMGSIIYHFMFHLNDDEVIMLNMQKKLSFIFSGCFLTHRQSSDVVSDNNKETFVNVSSYGNTMFFTYIHESFFRNMKC